MACYECTVRLEGALFLRLRLILQLLLLIGLHAVVVGMVMTPDFAAYYGQGRLRDGDFVCQHFHTVLVALVTSVPMLA